MPTIFRRTAIVVVSTVFITGAAHAGFLPIALQGQTAPDTGGMFGNSIGGVSVDQSGEAVFWSTIDGVPSTSGTGAFRTVDGVVQKIIQQGDAAPGLPGKTFDQIGDPNYSAAGVLAIQLRLKRDDDVTFDNDWGLWLDEGGGLVRIAQEGTAAPGLGGAMFDRPGEPILSQGGALGFHSRLKQVGDVTSDNDGTVWRRAVGGNVEMVAREGMPAPGIAGGAFRYVNTPSINDSTDVAFTGTAIPIPESRRRGVVDFNNDDGIWKTVGSELQLVVREGDSAPGIDGFTYGYFNRPLINNAGDLAFVATINSESADRGFVNDSAVFASVDGVVGKVAASGEPAVGAEGMDYGSMLWQSFNDKGDIVFGAYLDDGLSAATGDGRGFQPGGLWIRRGGSASIDPIAVSGDTAPGTDGALFDYTLSPVLNGAGDVVFGAALRIGGDVNFDNAQGVWAYLASGDGRGDAGQLIKVAREGDLFEESPGVFKTIEFLDVQGSGVEAFEPTPALNESGQLAIRVSFVEGGGGVYLFQIPTPGAGAILAMGGMLTARRRR